MGEIDRFSEFTVQDILDGELDYTDAFEFYGFHIQKVSEGRYGLQLDGHVGMIEEFEVADYDTTEGLIADWLDVYNRYIHEIDKRDDDELVEFAGPIWTDDEQKARSDDNYVYVDSTLE